MKRRDLRGLSKLFDFLIEKQAAENLLSAILERCNLDDWPVEGKRAFLLALARHAPPGEFGAIGSIATSHVNDYTVGEHIRAIAGLLGIEEDKLSDFVIALKHPRAS